MDLEAGTAAVVTGAASGIGAALAHRFAQAGLHVVLADVDEAGLAPTAEAVGAKGVDTLVVPTDVSQAEQVQALADATIERPGSRIRRSPWRAARSVTTAATAARSSRACPAW